MMSLAVIITRAFVENVVAISTDVATLLALDRWANTMN